MMHGARGRRVSLLHTVLLEGMQIYGWKLLAADTPLWVQLLVVAGGAAALACALRFCRAGNTDRIALRFVDPNASPGEAIALATKAMEAKQIVSTTDLILWFRDGPLGASPKAITIPAPVVEVLTSGSLLQSMAPVAKALWNRALTKQRWVHALDARRRTAFDDNNADDDRLLQELWRVAKLNGPYSRRSDQWERLGFQGKDPTTDFRGGGMLALDHIVSFAQTHPAILKQMMHFNQEQLDAGEGSWYLTAVVSIQLTVQLLCEKDHVYQRPQLQMLLEGGESEEGGIDGLRRVHHSLMIHFAKLWDEDRPHIMEYNAYMPKVFKSFFTA